ncbi:MAG: hypothetical protein MK239_08820 [Gemmatimonadetes bacterium]|nr:hypothetical protein [Gemmatimonadota bacterium]
MSEVWMDPIAIDVGEVLQRTQTSLYSHLVTRPTGRAVRMAIKTQLQGNSNRSFSLIDLSEVVILDFSCADEVVAKLLEDSIQGESREEFFVFRGVHERHRGQVQTVLERRGLAAVAETEPNKYSLLGQRSAAEGRAWMALEDAGLVTMGQIGTVFEERDQAAVSSLIDRRLAFRSPSSGGIHALSGLVAQFF